MVSLFAVAKSSNSTVHVMLCHLWYYFPNCHVIINQYNIIASALYTLHIPGVYVLNKATEHEVKFFPVKVFRVPHIENL